MLNIARLGAHEANPPVHRTVSVAEAATIPRDLWLDLVRISEAADLAGNGPKYGHNLQAKAAACTSWFIILVLQWG